VSDSIETKSLLTAIVEGSGEVRAILEIDTVLQPQPVAPQALWDSLSDEIQSTLREMIAEASENGISVRREATLHIGAYVDTFTVRVYPFTLTGSTEQLQMVQVVIEEPGLADDDQFSLANRRAQAWLQRLPIPLGILNVKTMKAEFANDRFLSSLGFKRSAGIPLDLDEVLIDEDFRTSQLRKFEESGLIEWQTVKLSKADGTRVSVVMSLQAHQSEDNSRAIMAFVEIEDYIDQLGALQDRNKILEADVTVLRRDLDKIADQIQLKLADSVLPRLIGLSDFLDKEDRHHIDNIIRELQRLYLSYGEDVSHVIRILSKREREICSRIRIGESSQQIADALKISKATVDKHRQSIRKKLEISKSKESIRAYLSRVAKQEPKPHQ